MNHNKEKWLTEASFKKEIEVIRKDLKPKSLYQELVRHKYTYCRQLYNGDWACFEEDNIDEEYIIKKENQKDFSLKEVK